MKLLFEDRTASWTDCFDVTDEIGNKLFRVEARQGAGRKRLKVYASYLHNKSVATLTESLNEPPAVEIKHGTRFVSVVRYLKHRKFFDLGFIDWYAAGNFENGNFFIYDANGRTVAAVYAASTKTGPCRVIDTLPEYTLHSLSFALAIRLQLAAEFLAPPLAETALV